jgi:hypothetical protein
MCIKLRAYLHPREDDDDVVGACPLHVASVFSVSRIQIPWTLVAPMEGHMDLTRLDLTVIGHVHESECVKAKSCLLVSLEFLLIELRQFSIGSPVHISLI